MIFNTIVAGLGGNFADLVTGTINGILVKAHFSDGKTTRSENSGVFQVPKNSILVIGPGQKDEFPTKNGGLNLLSTGGARSSWFEIYSVTGDFTLC